MDSPHRMGGRSGRVIGTSDLNQGVRQRRIVELDSLRGIAACVVVLCHLRSVFRTDTNLQWYLRPFFDGFVAVVLFFVLSGYVLALPTWRGTRPPYGQYITRRFFRIYVPYACAVCLAIIAGWHLIGTQLPLTGWFYRMWHTPLTPRLILSQLFLMDTSGKINVAFWSLRYEIEMSMLMPLICKVLRPLSVKWALLLAFGTEGVGVCGIHIFAKSSWKLELFTSILWSSCFMLGAIIARERDSIAKLYSSLSFRATVGFCLVSLGMFYYGHGYTAIPGACGIVILAENSCLRIALRQGIFEYLGRISYSLYLLHSTVLFTLIILFYQRLPTWFIIFLYLTITLAASQVFYFVIEAPSIQIGKRLSKRARPTSPTVTVY
jgi:peptidoglycan/LPS O-acetylase OafA/YrhL